VKERMVVIPKSKEGRLMTRIELVLLWSLWRALRSPKSLH
jgi:hypothetical protein